MTATVCRFKRHESDSWEYGLMIDEDQIIIDRKSKAVPSPVWNYELCTDLGRAIFIFPTTWHKS